MKQLIVFIVVLCLSELTFGFSLMEKPNRCLVERVGTKEIPAEAKEETKAPEKNAEPVKQEEASVKEKPSEKPEESVKEEIPKKKPAVKKKESSKKTVSYVKKEEVPVKEKVTEAKLEDEPAVAAEEDPVCTTSEIPVSDLPIDLSVKEEDTMVVPASDPSAESIYEESIKGTEDEPRREYYLYTWEGCTPCKQMIQEIKKNLPKDCELHIESGKRLTKSGDYVVYVPVLEVYEDGRLLYNEVGYRPWGYVEGKINK